MMPSPANNDLFPKDVLMSQAESVPAIMQRINQFENRVTARDFERVLGPTLGKHLWGKFVDLNHSVTRLWPLLSPSVAIEFSTLLRDRTLIGFDIHDCRLATYNAILNIPRELQSEFRTQEVVFEVKLADGEKVALGIQVPYPYDHTNTILPDSDIAKSFKAGIKAILKTVFSNVGVTHVVMMKNQLPYPVQKLIGTDRMEAEPTCPDCPDCPDRCGENL